MTHPVFKAVFIPSVIDAEGDESGHLTVEPDDTGQWLEVRQGFGESGGVTQAIYPDPQQAEALAAAILACARAIRALAQPEHDFSGMGALCRRCGGTASGSCRGYVPVCPACKQPAAWGTASLYFYCINRGQNCPMRGQNVWLQTRNDRWDSE